MPPKKEKKVMSFSEFTSMVQSEAPDVKSSWADEEIELPSALLNVETPDGFLDTRYGMDRIGRGPREGPPPAPVIDYARLPAGGPFCAFVANLPFEVTEADLRGLFQGLRTRDIKIPLDHERRGRGFAIVEFDDQDSLIKALLMSGQMVKNRYVRIDVSEGRAQDSKSFADDWRSGVAHQVSERGSGRPSFDRAPAGPERVFDRSQMAPVVAERKQAFGTDRGPAPSDRVFDRSSMAPVTAEPSVRSGPSEWRSGAKPTQSVGEAKQAPQKPALNLLPRSKPVPTGAPESAEVYAAKGKANPFGSAKPIQSK